MNDDLSLIKQRAIKIFIASLKSHGQDIYMDIPVDKLKKYKQEIDSASSSFSKSQFESLNHIYRKDHALHFYAQDREQGMTEQSALELLKSILDEISSLIIHTCGYLMSLETQDL